MTPYEALYMALSADVGVAVHTDNPTRFRTQLYQERQKQQKNGNYDLDDISIFPMPDGEIWIIRRAVLEEWRNSLVESDEILCPTPTGGR